MNKTAGFSTVFWSKSKRKRGFTLIELLVVVAIIGILASVGILSYQSTNRKARDGRREADLEQIRTSLEIYRSDYNLYPSTSGVVTTALQALVTGGYIASLPTDLKDPALVYYYVPGAGNLTYSLCAHQELSSSTSDSCGGSISCGDICNYVVTNP